MKMRSIGILGGGGFVGRHLVSELSRRHYHTRVLTRRAARHREVSVFPECTLIEADVHDSAALESGITGCDAVINLVGILNERRCAGATFERVHAELPAAVAAACLKLGIGRLLHMSALNAGPEGASEYLTSKGRGEAAVHAAADHGLQVTSFRPSVIYGDDDAFFNRFANLLAMSPPVFPLACPHARMAPIYVEDVVQAMANALADKRTAGHRYELCGPREYTLKAVVEYAARTSGHRRWILALGDGASRLQARLIGRLPNPPFSFDNYLSLSQPSVTDHNALPDLGVHPTSLETIVPGYLGDANRTGFYNGLRAAARRG